MDETVDPPMHESIHELLSQASVTREGDELVLRYALISQLIWACIPLLAVMWGSAGWVFVRWHERKHSPPSPSALPVKVFSTLAIVFGIVMAVTLNTAVYRTDVRITPTAVSQNVGLLGGGGVTVFAYADIAGITPMLEPDEFGSSVVWVITMTSDEIVWFNPGDLWSANQEVIAAEMRQHGVSVGNTDD